MVRGRPPHFSGRWNHTLANPGSADEGTRSVATATQEHVPHLLLQLRVLVGSKAHDHLAGRAITAQERRPVIIEIGKLEVRRDDVRHDLREPGRLHLRYWD